MTPTKNFNKIASSLTIVLILFGTALTSATTENNYKNDNNFLTNITESTHTENGYKTNIIINPDIVGIFAKENGYKLDLTINPQGIGGLHTENNYQLDLTPEKTFPDIPDIAITKIATSKTVVGQGYSIIINITASNQALNYETFYITLNANKTALKTQKITLTSMKLTTITFTWNTSGFAKGNYTINANAIPIPGETDTTDNTRTCWIVVTIAGDVDGDFDCDADDVFTYVSPAYGKKLGQPGYNPNCDFDGDNDCDADDVFTCLAPNYGKKDC